MATGASTFASNTDGMQPAHGTEPTSCSGIGTRNCIIVHVALSASHLLPTVGVAGSCAAEVKAQGSVKSNHSAAFACALYHMSDAEDNEEVEAPPPPKVIQSAELNAQYNLPIRAEKFRYEDEMVVATFFLLVCLFQVELLLTAISTQSVCSVTTLTASCSIGLAACPHEGNAADIDLSGAMFASDGRLLDAAYYGNPSALGGAIRHCGSNPMGSMHPDEESEIIHAFPALIPEDCCIMIFVVGGEQVSSCSSLTVTVHAKERKKGKVWHLLKPFFQKLHIPASS